MVKAVGTHPPTRLHVCGSHWSPGPTGGPGAQQGGSVFGTRGVWTSSSPEGREGLGLRTWRGRGGRGGDREEEPARPRRRPVPLQAQRQPEIANSNDGREVSVMTGRRRAKYRKMSERSKLNSSILFFWSGVTFGSARKVACCQDHLDGRTP